MTTVMQCKECGGTGTVVFTKERGGPTCNTCGGKGYMSAETIQRAIASMLDYPSVFMGGPSHQSMKRAKQIVEYLQELGDCIPPFD